MSVIPGEISLQKLLSNFKLSHVYMTLIEQEFDSLEILKECSEDDVTSLCNTLNLSLLDKLRFKRALKSVHIPQNASRYTIINKQEQNYIVAMDDAIKRMEEMVILPDNNNSATTAKEQLSKRYQLNENVIRSSFDMLIGKLQQKRDERLAQLKQIYEDRNNQEMMTHLHSAKNIKKQCQKLLLKDTKLNELYSRTNTIKTLNDECLNTEQQILDLKNTMCNIKNTCIKIRNDDDIQQFIHNFVTISNDEKDDDTSFILKVKKKKMNMNEITRDILARQHDDTTLFTHNPVRAWRWSQITNKWIRRGRGTVSLYHNKTQHISKLMFVDDESNSTTLLQYVDKNMTKLKCVKEGCVSWEAYDYSQKGIFTHLNDTSPQKGLWIMKFMSNANAASEFLEILNDQTEMLSNKNIKRRFKIPYIAHSKSAHSVMDFQQTIAIKKLYCFGKDINGNCCWIIKASHTELEFVKSHNRLIKLVVKQREDESLVMDHYISAQNANLILKQELVYQWNTYDSSVTTWSAKFYTNADAENFRVYFNKSEHCNLLIEKKLTETSIHPVEIVPEENDVNTILDHASKSVPPPQKDIKRISFMNPFSDAAKQQTPPKLAAGKSWDSAYANKSNKSAVLMVRPYANNQLEIISDEKQMEQDTEIQNHLELICEVQIRSLHRWCVAMQCWQLRIAKGSVLFYGNKKLNKVRLICKIKNDINGDNAWDFKLNHWICEKVANIKYEDKQFLWSAYDGCGLGKGEVSTFAAKFFCVDDAIRFQQQFLNYFQHNK